MAGGLARLRFYVARMQARSRFSFRGCHFEVMPGVLNPTLFRASFHFARMALSALPREPVRVLELGCGSGLTSVLLARVGHEVTAVDIDRHAVVNTEANAIRNDVGIKCLHSDWDSALGEEQWEWVITNPPFLPKETTPYQTALCAGEDLRVFIAAVAAVSRRIGTEGRGLILSSSVVPRGRVRNVLAESGLAVENTRVKRHWNEKLFGDWVSRSPRS